MIERASTGVEGLDAILGGGLPVNRMHLLHGQPGAGKTTVALQFLMAGRDVGQAVVYVALSESEDELRQIAGSHGWDLDGITICDLQGQDLRPESDAEYTFFHPSEIELNDTTRLILETLERVRPSRIVFDSLSEMRLMARDSLRYRRQVLSLKDYFTREGCTVLLLDTRLPRDAGEFQLETLAHGVMAMESSAPEYGGTRRRMRVDKLRGVKFVEGYHDYEITTGGVKVHPRLIPELRPVGDRPSVKAPVPFPSGVDEIDRMTGGGLERATTTMLIGPAGVGKSTLATQYCLNALRRGESVAVFHFDEGLDKWRQRALWLEPRFEEWIEDGRLHLRQINPAEMSPGQFAGLLRKVVEEDEVSVVVIDSVNGYRTSMPQELYLTLHLHELFSYLEQRNVLTLVIAAQHGFLGEGLDETFKLSYLADNVILLRYFEAFGSLRKAITMIKKRTGAHEQAIRELHLGPDGIRLGEELEEFQGILAGELVYSGREERLIDEPTAE